MAIYTVHLPPAGDPGEARLVRDGVNYGALLIPAIWLIWQRLWLPFLAYVLAVMVIGTIVRFFENEALLLLSVLPAFYLFVEGSDLVRGRLERLGWRLVSIVDGNSRAEAELRFFSNIAAEDMQKIPEAATAPAPAQPRSSAYSQRRPQGIGLFPE